MFQRNWIIVFLLLFCWITGCKKESQSTYTEKSAMVLNAGNLASDGCGWLLKLDQDNTVFSPLNLPELLQTDSLQVTISYNLLNTKFNCSSGSSFTQIKINSIRKKGAVRPD
ncbi:MAG: hypothetical protein ACRYFB_15160 [Janthinobacterium lividum]